MYQSQEPPARRIGSRLPRVKLSKASSWEAGGTTDEPLSRQVKGELNISMTEAANLDKMRRASRTTGIADAVPETVVTTPILA